jgi:ABC-type transporter MlaC component
MEAEAQAAAAASEAEAAQEMSLHDQMKAALEELAAEVEEEASGVSAKEAALDGELREAAGPAADALEVCR